MKDSVNILNQIHQRIELLENKHVLLRKFQKWDLNNNFINTPTSEELTGFSGSFYSQAVKSDRDDIRSIIDLSTKIQKLIVENITANQKKIDEGFNRLYSCLNFEENVLKNIFTDNSAVFCEEPLRVTNGKELNQFINTLYRGELALRLNLSMCVVLIKQITLCLRQFIEHIDADDEVKSAVINDKMMQIERLCQLVNNTLLDYDRLKPVIKKHIEEAKQNLKTVIEEERNNKQSFTKTVEQTDKFEIIGRQRSDTIYERGDFQMLDINDELTNSTYPSSTGAELFQQNHPDIDDKKGRQPLQHSVSAPTPLNTNGNSQEQFPPQPGALKYTKSFTNMKVPKSVVELYKPTESPSQANSKQPKESEQGKGSTFRFFKSNGHGSKKNEEFFLSLTR